MNSRTILDEMLKKVLLTERITPNDSSNKEEEIKSKEIRKCKDIDGKRRFREPHEV